MRFPGKAALILLAASFLGPAGAVCALDHADPNAVVTMGTYNLVPQALFYGYNYTTSSFNARQVININDPVNEKLGGYWDFNRDGYFDIVTYRTRFYTDQNAVDVHIYLYKYNPVTCLDRVEVFAHQFGISNVGTGCTGSDCRIAFGVRDVNGDGIFDFIFAVQGSTQYSANLYTVTNDGLGNANSGHLISQNLLLDQVRRIASRTLGDGRYSASGHPDVVILDYFSQDCAVMPVYRFRGIATPPFFEKYQNNLLFSTAYPQPAATIFGAGDINDDSKLDLFYGLDDDGDVGQLWKRLGNGDGTFQAQTEVFDTSTQDGQCPNSIGGDQGGTLALHDFNNDGVLDALVCKVTQQELYYVIGPLNQQAWNSRSTYIGSCTGIPMVGPAEVQCRQEYYTCSVDAQCCSTGSGYPYDQHCSGAPNGHCCPVGLEWNPNTASCGVPNCGICGSDWDCISNYCRTSYDGITKRCSPDSVQCVTNADTACNFPPTYRLCDLNGNYKECNTVGGEWSPVVNCDTNPTNLGCNLGNEVPQSHDPLNNFCGWNLQTNQYCSSGLAQGGGCFDNLPASCNDCTSFVSKDAHDSCYNSQVPNCDVGCGAQCDSTHGCSAPGSSCQNDCTCSAGNRPPVVNAGVDIYFQTDTPATISGTAIDPDGTIKTLQYSVTQAPSGGTCDLSRIVYQGAGTPGQQTATAAGPISCHGWGRYTLTLSATDNNDAPGSDSMYFYAMKPDCAECNSNAECSHGFCAGQPDWTLPKRCSPANKCVAFNQDTSCLVNLNYKACVGSGYLVCQTSNIWGDAHSCNVQQLAVGCNANGEYPTRNDHVVDGAFCAWEFDPPDTCHSGYAPADGCQITNPPVNCPPENDCGGNTSKYDGNQRCPRLPSLTYCDKGCGAACDQNSDCLCSGFKSDPAAECTDSCACTGSYACHAGTCGATCDISTPCPGLETCDPNTCQCSGANNPPTVEAYGQYQQIYQQNVFGGVSSMAWSSIPVTTMGWTVKSAPAGAVCTFNTPIRRGPGWASANGSLQCSLLGDYVLNVTATNANGMGSDTAMLKVRYAECHVCDSNDQCFSNRCETTYENDAVKRCASPPGSCVLNSDTSCRFPDGGSLCAGTAIDYYRNCVNGVWSTPDVCNDPANYQSCNYDSNHPSDPDHPEPQYGCGFRSTENACNDNLGGPGSCTNNFPVQCTTECGPHVADFPSNSVCTNDLNGCDIGCGATCDKFNTCGSSLRCDGGTCTCTTGIMGSIVILTAPDAYFADYLPRSQLFFARCYDNQGTPMSCDEIQWSKTGFSDAAGDQIANLVPQGSTPFDSALFSLQADTVTGGHGFIHAKMSAHPALDAVVEIISQSYQITVLPDPASLGYGQQLVFSITCSIGACPPPAADVSWELLGSLQGSIVATDPYTQNNHSILYTAPAVDSTGRINATLGSLSSQAHVTVSSAGPNTPGSQTLKSGIFLLSCPRLATGNETNITVQCLNASDGKPCDVNGIGIIGSPYDGPWLKGYGGFIYQIPTHIEGQVFLTATAGFPKGLVSSECTINKISRVSATVPDLSPVAVLLAVFCAVGILRRRNAAS